MVRRSLFASILTLASGCSVIAGLEDAELITDGGAKDATAGRAGFGTGGSSAAGSAGFGGSAAGAGGTSSGGSSGTGGGQADDAGPDGSPGDCSGRGVDDMRGVFVVAGGDTTSACGARSNPCASIQAGINRATTLGRSFVYVAAATQPYVEAITLAAAVRVEGAWGVIGMSWTPICTAQSSSAVTIQAPATSNTTVLADAIGGSATLALLTVKSKTQTAVQAGESLYGIVARGSTTALRLENVVVQLVHAGDGTAGAAGAPGGMAGKAGGCIPASDGANGPDGSIGPGATAGTFMSSGYVASKGGTGASGPSPGHNGTPPTKAPTCTPGCVNCGFNCVASPTGQMTCGTEGLPGCGGGAGGFGGGGGSGGGSSIGLFAWGATVTVTGGALTSGNGGKGGLGGSGGTGGAGAAGAVGSEQYCVTSCTQGTTCISNFSYGIAGGAGGQGGNGSKGGQGGGGAGGFSYAIYKGGAAVVMTSGATLTPGAAGTSLSNGAPGAAAAVGP